MGVDRGVWPLRRRATAVALTLTVCLPCLACAGGSSQSGSSVFVHPGARTPVRRLAVDEALLRSSLRHWRASDPALLDPPPPTALAAAADERRVVYELAKSPALARRTLAAFSPHDAAPLRAAVAAARDLQRLAGPSTGTPAPLHLVPPLPAGELLADYRAAQKRFGVHWQVLAAVNLIETAFGRVKQPQQRGRPGADAVSARDLAGVRPRRRYSLAPRRNSGSRQLPAPVGRSRRRSPRPVRVQPLDALRRRGAHVRAPDDARSARVPAGTTPGRRACPQRSADRTGMLIAGPGCR